MNSWIMTKNWASWGHGDQILTCSSFSHKGHLYQILKKFPEGVLEISHLQEWDWQMDGQSENITPGAMAVAEA